MTKVGLRLEIFFRARDVRNLLFQKPKLTPSSLLLIVVQISKEFNKGEDTRTP